MTTKIMSAKDRPDKPANNDITISEEFLLETQIDPNWEAYVTKSLIKKPDRK